MAFIVFEGLDGSGKSTLISTFAEKLKSHGIECILTREPGGTVLGEEVRRLLLSTEGEPPSPRCELLLYEAIRAQHVDVKIRPALEKGLWVLCDRYAASTVAFQVGGRGLSASSVDWLNRYATGGCQPDLWVLLDLTVDQAAKRLDGRKHSHRDRFEQEEKDFHERVRKKYLEISQTQENWLCLNGKRPLERLHEEILSKLKLDPRLGLNPRL